MWVSEEQYQALALADPDNKWELVCGELRSKPGMTARHNELGWRLGFLLQQQLGLSAYQVRVENGRVRRPGSTYYVPDVVVIPTALVLRHKTERPDALEVYDEPLPLIVEVWSPATGATDATDKLNDFRLRGDGEIWLLHGGTRTLTAYRRQPDGNYTETVSSGGLVHPATLPGVVIDLDELFDA